MTSNIPLPLRYFMVFALLLSFSIPGCSKDKEQKNLLNEKEACLGFIGKPLNCDYKSNVGNSGLADVSKEVLVKSVDLSYSEDRCTLKLTVQFKNNSMIGIVIIAGNKILMDSAGRSYQPQSIDIQQVRSLNPGDEADFEWTYSLRKELALDALFFATLLHVDKLHPEKGFKLVEKIQLKRKSQSMPSSGRKTTLEW